MALKGKGFYIWRIPWTDSGNLDTIIRLAQEANLGHVLVKIADGDEDYNRDPNTGADLVPPLLDRFNQAGITVWGWQYVYGRDAAAEADKAIQRVHSLGLEGFVVNAEKEFKFPDMDQVAEAYMTRLRQGLGEIPVALSSYRFPLSHREFPFDVFLSHVDLNIPQVYWEAAHNPVSQLSRCLDQFQDFAPVRPVIPTGAAYPAGGWMPTVDDVQDFLTAVRQFNLPAANFWSWEHSRRFIPKVWDAISDFDWPMGDEGEEIVQTYIDALNTRDPLNVVLLYALNGVHITAQETLQGPEKLLLWYNTLFEQTLPGATFTMTETSGEGSSRRFTWTAESPAGRVLNGRDTIGFLNGKITFHYTFFDVVQ